MRLTVSASAFLLAEAFVISRGSRTHARVITVEIFDGGFVGRGECVPYARYGETDASVTRLIEGLQLPIDRASLQRLLPAGAARNAVDCALWDLEAKKTGKRVWELAGLVKPKPEVTAFTLSLGTPESMQAAAAKNAFRPLLKIKLGGGSEDMTRLRAVRAGAPDTSIIVDANEGWDVAQYSALAPVLLELGVLLVEQPLPADNDNALHGLDRPLPVCADESAHDSSTLSNLSGKYDVVNIKLDKTGGLTEALRLKSAAIVAGYDVMVGCMVGTSLAMAPAVLVAQGVKFTDLDGPLLLAEDRENPLHYDERGVHPPLANLWG